MEERGRCTGEYKCFEEERKGSTNEPLDAVYQGTHVSFGFPLDSDTCWNLRAACGYGCGRCYLELVTKLHDVAYTFRMDTISGNSRGST